MKKLILSLVAIATIALTTFGQAPEGFKYQAVVRDAGNTILNNQAVGMQIEILQGGIAGTPVYTESFAPTTNNYGLVNLEIGTGSTSDDFTTIDWANDTYFIRTSIDVSGGSTYSVMGTSQLMSVPYALHAKTAESSLIDNVDDADSDASNELQTISRSGSTVTLSNGGGTYTDSVNIYTGGSGIDITNNVVSASEPTYTIGLWPELGGYVFWISSDGKHGLVCETQNQGVSSWYNAQNLISNPLNHSTDGKKFRDWRMPTIYEINELMMFAGPIGGFGWNWYWAATEYSETLGAFYSYDFMGSYSDWTFKTNTSLSLRSVRTF